MRTEPAAGPRRDWVAAAALLAVFYAALLVGVRNKSATIDEPGHAVAGYTYWKYNDYRLDPENGNLPQRWIALPLLFAGVRPPARDATAWRTAEIVALADSWLYGPDNNAPKVLAWGRAASGLLAVVLGALIWWWSRRLFGGWGGLLSLLIYICNPAFLANGALMTSDTASALLLLVSLHGFWSMLESPTVGRIGLSGVTIGALFVTKMSALIFVPVALVLTALRLLDPRPFRPGSTAGSAGWQRARTLGTIALAHGVLIAVVIWSAYGFRYRALAAGSDAASPLNWEWALNRPAPAALLEALRLEPAAAERSAAVFAAYGADATQWSEAAREALNEIARSVLADTQRAQLAALRAAPPSSLPLRIAAFAQEHELLPEAFIHGFAHLWISNTGRVAFLNGEVRVNEGFRWFFPFAFLVKTPLALFGIMALGVACLVRGPRKSENGASEARRLWTSPVLPLVVFMVFYGAAAIASNINIGHRHLLPIYPPLFILCGAAGWLLPGGRGQNEPGGASFARVRGYRAVLLALVAVLLVETLSWFPNYLAYFNGIVRPSRAYQHLVDSSLDWGQDLPALRRYLDEHRPPGRTYLAIYGRGPRPDYYGIAATRVLWGVASPFLVVPGISPESHGSAIAEFYRTHPEYDPAVNANLPLGNGMGMVFMRRGEELRLSAGTYFIGASCIQPIHPRAAGRWNEAYEAAYQQRRAQFAPLLAEDPAIRRAGMGSRPITEFASTFYEFNVLRFSRLTAYLRTREPDDQINHSILIYRLSDADIARALEGPAPDEQGTSKKKS